MTKNLLPVVNWFKEGYSRANCSFRGLNNRRVPILLLEDSLFVITNYFLNCHFEFKNRLEIIITCFAGHAKATTATCAKRLSGAAPSIMDPRAANSIPTDSISIMP